MLFIDLDWLPLLLAVLFALAVLIATSAGPGQGPARLALHKAPWLSLAAAVVSYAMWGAVFTALALMTVAATYRIGGGKRFRIVPARRS